MSDCVKLSTVFKGRKLNFEDFLESNATFSMVRTTSERRRLFRINCGLYIMSLTFLVAYGVQVEMVRSGRLALR